MQTLSGTFAINNGLKEGDALSSLPFYFALKYAIRKVKANHKIIKLKGTYQVLIYTDDVNVWGSKYINHKLYWSTVRRPV